MRYFHTTGAAARIVGEGFRDTEGSYGLATTILRGVFLADEPLSWQEGANGDAVLEVTLPDDLDLADFEIIEEGKGYREWCVPASLLNSRATVRTLP